mgnify:CR=1 FL=1
MSQEEGAMAALIAMGGAIILVFLLIALVVAILYLLNLQNLMKSIKEENREVSPGNVWLMLIPLFSLVYAFILYPKISASVKKELESREMDTEGDGAKNLGLALAITGALSLIPVIGGLAGLANLVIFIMWWVKTAGFKNKFQ